MAELLEIPSHGGSVLIAVRGAEGDDVAAVGMLGKATKKVKASLDDIFSVVSEVSRSFAEALAGAPVTSASLELSLQFTAGGRIYVVDSEAQAALKVTLSVTPAGRT